MTDARNDKSMISLVFSFRNEADVLEELIARVTKMFAGVGCPYEVIFVNDLSTDDSLKILEKHAAANKAIKIINMSRNFGVSECVLAGMKYAKGDAIIYMDTDLQDPPEVIPEMIEKWREGADLVYTRRLSRDGETAFRLWATKVAYKIINFRSEIELPIEAGDFRLLSRRAVDKLLTLEESQPYLRGITQWIGFERAEVPYRRQPRAAGETHFPGVFSRGPVKTFVDGLTSFSMFPLHLVLYAGLAGTALGAGGLVLTGLAALIGWGCAVAGWVFFALLLWGGLMSGMGILGLYISRIYRDTRNRPLYIVKDTVNFD
ncbi:MAG: glycosyltransferase family 2 protein [Rhodospirillales bacterium]|nr:glycosyltransferase family 2 protein [Rhodospirillales bacterium]MBO6786841.1 glycosyltransferase family 2 protein [Rhodospirillales bacterium]